jgi:hypothetical protein
MEIGEHMQSNEITDYDFLLRSNLERVFCERDPQRRAAAIAELFVADPIMFEPDGVVHGREAISRVAGGLLEKFGPDFTFVAEGRAAGHHGMGVLRWSTQAGPAPLTGMDVAEISAGRIARLWVLLGQ